MFRTHVPNFLVSNRSATVPPATARNALPVNRHESEDHMHRYTRGILANFALKELLCVLRALLESATGMVKTTTYLSDINRSLPDALTQKGEKAPQVNDSPSNKFGDRTQE